MRFSVGLALTCAMVAPALAQPAQAAAQNDQVYRKLPPKNATRDFTIYVQCIASRRADRARALALAPYGSAEQVRAASQVYLSVDDPCIRTGFDDVRMTIRPDVLAGGVAQALLLRDYPDLDAVIDPAKVDVDAERTRAAQLDATERFGRCIVWNNPAGVRALLQSEPTSPAERQAVEALKEDMGTCLAEGSTLQINRMFLRNVTAVAAYRLAQQLRPLARTEERQR